MLIALATLIVAAPGVQEKSVAWPAAMSKGSRAPRRIDIVVADPSDSVILDGSSGTPDQTGDRLGTALRTAAKASEENRLDAARLTLERTATEFPNADPLVLPRLADVYFRLGRNKDAYAAIAPHMKDGADEAVLLRGSLAAARMGEVYPGQRAFLDDYFRERVTSQWDSVKGSVPRGESPHAVETLSLLALGRKEDGFSDANALYYMGEALRKDPGNPVACATLGDVHLRNRRYPEAAKAYRAGLKRAQGYFKAWIGDNLGVAESLQGSKGLSKTARRS